MTKEETIPVSSGAAGRVKWSGASRLFGVAC